MTGIHLTGSEQDRLRAAQEALLSPLSNPSPREWQLRCNEATRAYLGAEHSAFSVPSPGAAPLPVAGSALPPVYSNDTPVTFEERVHEVMVACFSSDLDPYLTRAVRRRLERGPGAYHLDELLTPQQQDRSVAVQEVFRPAGMPYMVGLSLPLPEGEATQWLGFEHRDAAGYSEEGLQKLWLLVPAFVRGVEMVRAAMDRDRSLLTHFDLLQQPVAVYDIRGRRKHRNRALETVLAEEPEAERVGAVIDSLAKTFRDRHHGPARAQDPLRVEVETRIETRAGSYALWGGYGPADPAGEPSILIQLESLRRVPQPETIEERYGLTPREAAVALLLAEGYSDKAVAKELDISWHTARTHAKRVLGKLEISSRAEIALFLVRQAPTPDVP